MECKICLKKFSNAKAVGAHMKSHYAPLKLPNLTESSSLSSSQCKICFKKFSNGKAVAAHMKSHPLPKTPAGEEEEEKSKAKKKRPLTKKLKQIMDPTEFVLAGNSVGRKRKSDCDSTGGVGKLEFDDEFEVASCLMTLSRDVRVISSSSPTPGSVISDDSDGLSRKTRHQCDVCKKYFQKSQGLGTHRKTHEKKENGDHGLVEKTRKKTKKNKTVVNEQEVHECEFCEEVFGSVFELAGHKRWHLALLGNVYDGDGDGDEIRRCSTTCNSIDLNLPPPDEDDDDIMKQECN